MSSCFAANPEITEIKKATRRSDQRSSRANNLADFAYPFKVLVAFSGEKEVDGVPYTEAGMNGVSEEKTKEFFDGHDRDGKLIIHNGKSIENTYRLLVVANKYLTGLDQPKLSAMYVDK